MQLETSRFGTVEVQEDRLWHFAKGIPGFERYRSYAHIEEEGNPFSFLQCIEDADLAFIITNPFHFCPTYEFTLSDSTTQQLNIKSGNQVAVYSIVTIRRGQTQPTMNLMAPLIMNVDTLQAQQIILNDTEYCTNHKIVFGESTISEVNG